MQQEGTGSPLEGEEEESALSRRITLADWVDRPLILPELFAEDEKPDKCVALLLLYKEGAYTRIRLPCTDAAQPPPPAHSILYSSIRPQVQLHPWRASYRVRE